MVAERVIMMASIPAKKNDGKYGWYYYCVRELVTTYSSAAIASCCRRREDVSAGQLLERV